jgi:hypothetical protein
MSDRSSRYSTAIEEIENGGMIFSTRSQSKIMNGMVGRGVPNF